MNRNRNLVLVLPVIVLIGLMFLVAGTLRTVTGAPMTWSQAKKAVASGEVERVIFDDPDVVLFFKGVGDAGTPKTARVVQVAGDEEFVKLLDAQNVNYERRRPNACVDGGGWIWALMLVVFFWFFMTRREGGVPPGVATFGKSQAKLVPEEGTGVDFEDVAGIDEAIAELKEIVAFLKTPEKFTILGGKIPKGVLLVGPPGTGKTLLARAVAGEAEVPFFSISGSGFVEMFVGVGAARVRDLFQTAAEHAPCIIFIDELDAIGKSRGGSSPVGGNDEREQTLNQLLVEMDGFDGRKGIILIAATNRPEILDPALLRAGRFDRQVMVDRPDVKGRLAILKVHAEEIKLSDQVDLGVVARMTPGFAGADLANVLNEAALLAARLDKKAIELTDIEEAIERVVAGLEKKSRRLNDTERRVVAYHEAGHAICAAGSPGADPVQKISIIPRGIGALGYTMQTPLEDRYLMTRIELINRLVVLYGGRAAEEAVFGDFTTGASDDIRRASDLARRMVTQYGMSDSLGAVDYGADRPSPFGIGSTSRDVAVSEQTAQEIDSEARRILEAAHHRARAILANHRDLLERMANHLLEQEVLDREDLNTFLEEVVPLPESMPSNIRIMPKPKLKPKLQLEPDEGADEGEGEGEGEDVTEEQPAG